eukprot:CAMPEP_0196692468 /NCGR_PEP_ID=MMETSP1090-20130531/27549_1 /TAXON_ID=37098 /ORGANISM="Isochrysis sp, Strain CCMP1244" /LENGTH=63 /DNA_ID=CAMNT_0042031845 /DNA_START=87 /DNA_END=275 /DNA_ORIENTATION=+
MGRNPPDCVIAAEQVHESRSPPGRTALIARELIWRYFRPARLRSLTDGASLGGSQTTTSKLSA